MSYSIWFFFCMQTNCILFTIRGVKNLTRHLILFLLLLILDRYIQQNKLSGRVPHAWLPRCRPRAPRGSALRAPLWLTPAASSIDICINSTCDVRVWLVNCTSSQTLTIIIVTGNDSLIIIITDFPKIINTFFYIRQGYKSFLYIRLMIIEIRYVFAFARTTYF